MGKMPISNLNRISIGLFVKIWLDVLARLEVQILLRQPGPGGRCPSTVPQHVAFFCIRSDASTDRHTSTRSASFRLAEAE